MTSQRAMKFNDNETARFLELYEMENVLYDPSLEDYRDRDLRAAAAKRISHALNTPGFGPKEVVTKFKNLRSSYCQELKKIADSERSGSSTDDIYKPKVFWFEKMNSFIHPFVQQRDTKVIPVLPNKSNEQPSEQEQSETQVEDRSAEEHSEEALPCTQPSTSEIETPRNTVKRNISSNQSHPGKTKNRKTAHDYEINFMSAAIDKLQDISNRASQVAVNKDDSYDCFGKYVASMLRSIGPPTAMRLQQTMTNMLTNAMCPPENPSDSDHSRQATSGMESTGSAFSPSNDEDYYFLRDLDNNHLQ